MLSWTPQTSPCKVLSPDRGLDLSHGIEAAVPRPWVLRSRNLAGGCEVIRGRCKAAMSLLISGRSKSSVFVRISAHRHLLRLKRPICPWPPSLTISSAALNLCWSMGPQYCFTSRTYALERPEVRTFKKGETLHRLDMRS